jgi:uncharacterized protein YndB with AHSA1/START domain
MKDLKLSVEIAKPAKDIFDFALNPHNTPKWIDFIAVEETNQWPAQKGTIYRNKGSNGDAWSEFEVTEYEASKLFALSKKDGSYHVRYVLVPLTPNKTRLDYYEWTDESELEVPFTIEPLHKLKRLLEEAD